MADNSQVAIRLPWPAGGNLDCPLCWTVQRADREHCYYCGARFVFEAEQPSQSSDSSSSITI